MICCCYSLICYNHSWLYYWDSDNGDLVSAEMSKISSLRCRYEKRTEHHNGFSGDTLRIEKIPIYTRWMLWFSVLPGFQYVHNSELVQTVFEEDFLLATSKNIDESSLHRHLGLWWNFQDDNFSFMLNYQEENTEPPTKRRVLRAEMSLFDPLGFIAFLPSREKYSR